MGDLIDRQAAINAISCDITITGRQNAELVAATIGAFADRIKALPSAQPERKMGKWKITYLDHEAFGERPKIFYCSVCNQCIAYPTNFCPSCGSDMRR